MSASVTKRDADSVRRWAGIVLRQLDAPAGVTLDVTAAHTGDDAEQPPAAADGAAFTSDLRLPDGTADGTPGPGDGVTVRLGYPDGSSATVFLARDLDDARAVAELAGQLQDSVLESTGGAPAPRCPVAGHGHPAVAEVVGGTACWTCPSGGPAHPVLPAAG